MRIAFFKGQREDKRSGYGGCFDPIRDFDNTGIHHIDTLAICSMTGTTWTIELSNIHGTVIEQKGRTADSENNTGNKGEKRLLRASPQARDANQNALTLYTSEREPRRFGLLRNEFYLLSANRSVGGTERKGATLLPAVLVAVDGSPPSLGKRTDDVELRVGVTDVEVGSISNSCSSSSSNSGSGSSGGGGLVGLPCPGLAWSHPHKPVATHPTPF
ncbi:hypothetical protein HZH66_006869 [Vespula vulgaris]|uniref:Uncharacterized protein n=1 Tax=Vespula vulgaris TaxID=7454 RepID=A0A834N7D7_VESVU|nr:hypothetical protein HZH66_006869 [Vespula vulgaris]